MLFPARSGSTPVTKRELLRYSAQIAPVALPYLAHRALNMNRFPNGAETKGFWHKQLPDHAPEWVPRWENPEADAGESRTYLVVDEPAALVWAANFGALEWHAWTSLIDSPHLPTYALIDLDPGETTTWDDMLVLARLHRTALEHLGVHGQPKVTGRRGIQIRIPISPGPSFSETRAWTEKLSRIIGAVVPDLLSWKWQVSDPQRLGPTGLHAKRDQQDPRGALQPASCARRTGVGADRVGRAGRPRPGPGRVHRSNDPGANRREGRPVPTGADARPTAACDQLRATIGRFR